MIRTLVAAVLLVCLTFPDVVFTDSSFRLNDQSWGLRQGAAPSHLYPTPAHTTWYTAGLTDPGGSLAQSEPMMEFMRHNLWAGESPYWNPYSAAGSAGPETMVDLKFSVFTFAYSILGGGTAVFDILMLLGFGLGAFFVILACQRHLNLSFWPSLAAGVVYLLNGFSSANIGSNVALSYFLAPLAVHAGLAFVVSRSASTFARMAICLALFLSFTFAPTTIALMAATLVCIGAFSFSRAGRIRQAVGDLLAFVLASGVALLALSFIYAPLLEGIGEVGILSDYERRTFYPASIVALLSMLTPSHFFESYRAGEPGAFAFAGNTIFHFGVVAMTFVAAAFSTQRKDLRPFAFIVGGFALLVLARIFGAPLVTQFVDLLPVVGSLGAQYVWAAVALCSVYICGCGAQALLDGRVSRTVLSAFILAAFASGAAIYLQYGLREPQIDFKFVSLVATIALAFVAWSAIGSMQDAPRARPALVGALTVLMFAELIWAAKFYRFGEHDIYRRPTSEVAFLRDNLGFDRSMTMGPYATAFDAGSAYQIQEVTSLTPGTLPRYTTYFNDMIEGVPPASRFGSFPSLAMPQAEQDLGFYDWRKVDMLGVRYIVFPTAWAGYRDLFPANGYPIAHVSQFTTVVENRNAFPRAFATRTVSIANGTAELPGTLLPSDVAQIEISRYGNSYLRLEGHVAEPSFIVLTDNWHPTWRATSNGNPVEILPVDGVFRGIQVAAGPVSIEMSYRPRSLTAAIGVSCLVGGSLFLVAFIGPLLPTGRVKTSARQRARREDARDGVSPEPT